MWLLRKLRLYTYWAVVLHVAHMVLPPSAFPSTFPIALTVALGGEFLNLFVKKYPDRMNDLITHWLPLGIVWYTQCPDISPRSLALLMVSVVAYFLFHGASVRRIHALYRDLP